MSNMSYCRFENTTSDLKDCVLTIEDVCTIDELDLPPSELEALELMAVLCQRFIDTYETMVQKN